LSHYGRVEMRYSPIAFCLLSLSLAGCATIIEGTGQSINIATSPPGASCTVDRMGARLGQISPTPGTLRIDKSKSDIVVTCVAPGFSPASVTQAPTFGGTTFGNIVAGGLIGAAVDASTGANYEYPQQIIVQLPPAAPAVPMSPAPTYPPPYAIQPRQPGM
jgi:predicted small secreted protein